MRRRIVGGVAVFVVVVGVGLGAKFGRYHFIPKRFAVVEAGKVYRGGEQEAGPYARIIQERGIRTVVTLLDEEAEDRLERVEREMVAELELKRLRFPMPGDGRGEFDVLEGAAAAIADPQNQPVFLHCAAGVHRTGATVAVYRMKHCGWDVERALDELAEHWVSEARKPGLFEHLRAYYRERIAKGAEAEGVQKSGG
jgi:tyrosine-protein phosphatase SIW14